MISKSLGLSLFPFQCLAKMSGACCLCLPRSCVGLTSQTCPLSKPRSVSKHTIKNYVVAHKVTMKTAGDNITLNEIMYSAGIESSSISTEHYFSKALQLDFCKSCDFLPLENVTFLEKVAIALFSDYAFSNTKFFNLKTHG